MSKFAEQIIKDCHKVKGLSTSKKEQKERAQVMNNTPNCPDCGAAMMRATRPEVIHHRGQSLSIRQPGFYCTACDEVLLTPDDIRATESAIMDFRAGENHKTKVLVSSQVEKDAC